MSSTRQDLLQPALLDRLTDHRPALKTDTEAELIITRERLLRMVLRDLEALLNSRCPISKAVLQSRPELKGTVLSYGMPCLAGETMTTLDVQDLEREVKSLIVAFEPRIDAESLRVKAVFQEVLLNRYNVVGMHITGLLWAQPYPIELLLKTEVDLETGYVNVNPLHS